MKNMKSVFLEVILCINEKAPGLSQLIPAHNAGEGQREEHGFISSFHLAVFQVEQTEQLGAHQLHSAFCSKSCKLHNAFEGTPH